MARRSRPRASATAVFLRLGPAILVDAAEQPVGLARSAKLGDHLLEHLFGVLEALLAVEREAELLAHHLGALQRPRHAVVKLDHGGIGLDVAQRQIEIDDHAGLDLVEILERRLGGDRFTASAPLRTAAASRSLYFFE